MIINTHFFMADANNMELLSLDENGFPFLCMKTRIGPGELFPWHWHSAFEIDFILNGSVIVGLPDREIRLSKGDCIFFNSGILHSYRQVGEETCVLHACLFDINFLAGMNHNQIVTKYIQPIISCGALDAYQVKPVDTANVGMLVSLLRATELAEKEPFGYELEIRWEISRFWCFLLHATESVRAGSKKRKNTDMERVKLCINYMQEHYSEELSLEVIARAANIGKRECTRCFMRCINTTPFKYLNNYRIQKAAALLLETDRTIMEISNDCGFSSASYFGKLFREKTGMTPLQYRKGKTGG